MSFRIAISFIEDSLPSDAAFNRASLVSLNTLRASMSRRIHNNGKATDGSLIGRPPIAANRIGVYSAAHGKKRRARALRTTVKDLQFDGNLLRSFQVGESRNKPVIGFANTGSKNIASYQERQVKKEIWSPSDSEINNAIKILADAL